jgi:hypothetical protein
MAAQADYAMGACYDQSRMLKWANKLAVAFAVMLIWSSVQCVSACFADDCKPTASTKPSCPRHPKPDSKKAPASTCSHQIVTGDVAPSATLHSGSDETTPVATLVFAVYQTGTETPLMDASPPGGPPRTLLILRV